MEITIKAEAKEVAALVNELQGQQKSINHTVNNLYGKNNETRKFLALDETRRDVSFADTI